MAKFYLSIDQGTTSSRAVLYNKTFEEVAHEQLEFKQRGSMFFPDPVHGDYEVSYKFVNDGFSNLLLNNKINIKCPIRLLHGKQDKVVPVITSQRIIEQILSEDKDLIVIDDGDHSLSRIEDLR